MNRPIPKSPREAAAVVADIRDRLGKGAGRATLHLSYDRAELGIHIPTWRGSAFVQLTLTREQLQQVRETLPRRPSPAETAQARSLLVDFRYLEEAGAE